MKLPNFFESSDLNSLKEKMGLKKEDYGELSTPEISKGGDFLEKLKGVGVDINPDDLFVADDNTFVLNGERVLVYIRDIYSHQSHPKFHLANCKTISYMMNSNKFGKYVASTRVNGFFNVNLIENNRPENRDIKLDVCQNCLNLLRFDGFSYKAWHKQKRENYVFNLFSLDDFFEKYKKTPHSIKPKYDSATAPINVYSSDFNKISLRVRESARWVCQNCGKDFSQADYRRFLHVHHINGLKHDNSDKNLKALCVLCHANQPNHSHMKNTPDYIWLKNLFSY